MHRAYQPMKPVTNRYLQQRWDEDQFNQHRKKVSCALPTVDTRGMDIPAHVQLKLKKLQLQDEKLSAIDRDNRILASKLSDIVRSKGVVDHRNHYQIRSLNREKRKEEMLQVCVQNQAIYHRISARQSEYRRCVWLDEWERAEQRRDDITRYPRKSKRGRRRVQFAASESGDTGEQSESTTDSNLSDSASTTTTEEKDTQRDE